MLDQRGGILSKLFIVPAAVILMAGIFFLGYYLGRYQGKSTDSNAGLPPLPEVAAQNLPRPEDFTFYKTLTAKEDKTVSIDLHPRPASEDGSAGRQQADKPTNNPAKEPASQQSKVKEAETRNGGKTSAPKKAAEGAGRKTAEAKKKEVPAKQTASLKQRYSVQISAHQEKQTADLEVKKMKHQGFPAFVVSSGLPGRGAWYRVRIGSFTSKAAAERLQKEVRAKAGVSSIVVEE